jgi:two-component system chemotaxis sensor kinase CheA
MDPSETHEPRGLARISIPNLRKLILAVLTVSVLGFTAGVFVMVGNIFDNFGPRVREDLAWKTVRGAQELAGATELGFAMADGSAVRVAFGDYRASKDVLAIVAVNPAGKLVAAHGRSPESIDRLFAGSPRQLRETPGYFVSWARSFIESSEVGRVAVVVSTARLAESKMLLRNILLTAGLAGLLALVSGLVFVTYFTGAIAQRDARLARHASTLEHKVAERTLELDRRNRGMHLVLDNVDQGFITVDTAGAMEPERSAIVDRWLGPAAPGQLFQDYIKPRDPNAAAWFDLSLAALRDDQLPLELILDQMPKRMALDASTLRLDYIAITEAGVVQRLLIVMSDVTTALAREQIQREQRELLHLFQSVNDDRSGFEEFLREAEQLVARISDPQTGDPIVSRRLVHTLKGACNLFQLQSVADLCHGIETRMAEEGTGLTPHDRGAIAQAWGMVAERARHLLGDGRREVMEVEPADYDRLRALIAAGAPHGQLDQLLGEWQLEPLARRLSRLGHRARQMAADLGKAVDIAVDAAGVRIQPGQYDPFFATLSHLVRNALDHGIESPEQRLERGKPRAGRLGFAGRIDHGRLVIAISDDGSGIDWARVAARARASGLPHDNEQQLVEALFSDGFSTREEITLVSGRGVGLAAVRAALSPLGGTVEVRSTTGEGTCFEFSFPAAAASPGVRAA